MIIENKARNLLISISFFIIVFLNFIAQTVFVEKYYWLNVVKNYGLISISVLLLIIFILSKHTRKSLIASLLIILLAIVVSYYSANPYAIMPWILMVVNVDATNYKHLIKLWVIEMGILMLIVAVSYSIGWLDESRKILVRSDGATRYSLGYVYTTFSANYFFHFTIFYIYIRTMAIRYSELLMLLIINYYVYDLTDTKAAFVVSGLSILLVVILKIYNIRVTENVYRVVNKYVLIVCTFIPIMLTYLYGMGYGFLDELNRILTSRLQLGWNAINIYNINLFGQKIEWINETQYLSEVQYLYVDSSFLNILLNYGIVLLFLILLSFYLLGKLNFTKNLSYLIAISMIGIHSMFDPQFLLIMYNPLIIMPGILLRRNILSN